MSTKKKKPLSLTVKKPPVIKPAALVPAPGESETEGNPAAAPVDMTEGAAASSEPEEIDDPNYATREILDYAFKTWAGSFMNPMFYFMTRTFAHHRKGEKYDTGLVFNQLMQINGGNHDALLDDIRAYGETLQAELETYLAGQGTKR